jgi:hypothetical protein
MCAARWNLVRPTSDYTTLRLWLDMYLQRAWVPVDGTATVRTGGADLKKLHQKRQTGASGDITATAQRRRRNLSTRSTYSALSRESGK